MAKRKGGVIHNLGGRTAAFSFWFVALFTLSFFFLASMDALPEPREDLRDSDAPAAAIQSNPELPARVVAKDIGLDTLVQNPTSTTLSVLDAALLKGAVRHPDSAKLGVNGTVMIFGHSSYLPVVHNRAYKAFNGIQKLKVGQTVSVFSGGREYRYEVEGVRLANATEDVVELRSNGQYLALVTCDSFASKSSRFVVTAKLVGVYKYEQT
jgi:LPXTG-site transpeptidase (sortase) family protein